jgi:hypothetical protein
VTPLQQAAYDRGYQDRKAGLSDFVRRSYPHSTGERAAYMQGRFHAAVDTARKEND